MRKIKILTVGIMVAIMVCITGCTDMNNQMMQLQVNGASLKIMEADTPVVIDLIGDNNTISIHKDVAVAEIKVFASSENNIIYLYGNQLMNHTSSWDKHDCDYVNWGEHNQIILYQEEMP